MATGTETEVTKIISAGNTRKQVGERVMKRELPIMTLKKKYATGGKVWRRRLIQYVRIIQLIDIAKTSTDEIMQQEYYKTLEEGPLWTY